MKRMLTIVTWLLLVGVFAAPIVPVYADPPKKKCNSSGGNGGEAGEPATNCDPGSSGGHNNGGD